MSRQPKIPTLLDEAKYQAQLLQFRYELSIGLYVMLPGEKLTFNILHLFVATLLLSAIYCYMPLVLIHAASPYYKLTASGQLHLQRFLRQRALLGYSTGRFTRTRIERSICKPVIWSRGCEC